MLVFRGGGEIEIIMLGSPKTVRGVDHVVGFLTILGIIMRNVLTK